MNWKSLVFGLGTVLVCTNLMAFGIQPPGLVGSGSDAVSRQATAQVAEAVTAASESIPARANQIEYAPDGPWSFVTYAPRTTAQQINAEDRGSGDPPVEACPDDALFSQRCATPDDFGIGRTMSDLEMGYVAYESFWDVRGIITGLSWYGTFTDAVGMDCAQGPKEFEIKFYADNDGMPGTEVASYTSTVTGEPSNQQFGMEYATRFTVELSSPVELESGWISIAGAGEPDGCMFGWLSDPMMVDPPGDGRSCYFDGSQIACQQPGDMMSWDLNMCILGVFYPGACCNDLLHQCESDVAYEDCAPPLRFSPGVACVDLDPPCGDITGACCTGETCSVLTPAECEQAGGVYKGDYVPCDPNPCVGACCLGNHVCEVYTEVDCLGLGGNFYGEGTNCDPNPCPPNNDDCANAEAVTEGDWQFDTTYATLDGPEMCGLGQNVWFCYTATATGTATVGAEDFGGALLSGAAYDGCGCDPFPSLMVCADYGSSTFDMNVRAGHQYLIEIGHAYGEDQGAMGALHITLEPWAFGACCSEESPFCTETFEQDCLGTFGGEGTTCGDDCDGNGIADACDIATGLSGDCNGNGIPDGCDISAGTSDDYDLNGVPDECDPDCNHNGIIDGCDLDCTTGNCSALVGCGGSTDCQADGIPDECQLGGLGGEEVILWDNGAPAYGDPYYNVLYSQLGGYDDGAFVVDDFELLEGGTVDTFHADFEETIDFEWNGLVLLEIYADSGEYGPDQMAGPIVQAMIPTDFGSVTRTFTGDRPMGPGYRYELADLGIELPAGIWWIGIAPAGGASGNAGWSISRSAENVVMDECFLRWPSIGLPFFASSFEVWGMPWDVSFTVGTTVSGADCNENLIPDDCDIMYCDGSSWCQDCNENGVPDGCEPDCNANEIADECDIRDCDGSLWCQDCNENGIPDGCEPDCNGNGVPDDCDLRDCDNSPWCSDCNQNGVIDACDISDGSSDDYDLNGTPDECDPDCNDNGVPDACDLECSTGNCSSHPLGCGQSLDCQLDSIPDECQLIGQHVYLTDDGESATSVGLTNGGHIAWLTQFNVEPNYEVIDAISICWGLVPVGASATVYVWSDYNNDGDPYDAKVLASVDTVVAVPNTDFPVTLNIPATYVGPEGTSFFVGAIMKFAAGDRPAPIDIDDSKERSWLVADSDNPIDPNYLGLASIGPRLIDYNIAGNWLVRAVGAYHNDCNSNDLPDDCDIASGYSTDCDANGIPDECEWQDCNSNGILDACDIAGCPAGELWCADCNGNGIPDGCDITDGSPDCQNNGIPDECEEDCNANGVPDDCDLRDCDGSAWCEDCNEDGILDACQVSLPGGAAYFYDDGSSENSIGEGEPCEVAWIQRYDAIHGSETITSIATCFGNSPAPGWTGLTTGQSFRVFIWDDPNNDHDPSDAVLLASSTAYVNGASIDSDVLQVVPVDAVEVSGSFFIGAAIESSMWPAPADYSRNTIGEAWWAFAYAGEGGFDPEGFTAQRMDDIGFPISFLLRAISQPGPGANDCNGNGVPDECDLLGDLDGNGSVDYDDYVMFRSAFGGAADGNPACDYCCDYDDSGAVGLADYNTWLAGYRDFIGDEFAGPPEAPNAPTPVIGGQGNLKKKQSAPTGGATIQRLR